MNTQSPQKGLVVKQARCQRTLWLCDDAGDFHRLTLPQILWRRPAGSHADRAVNRQPLAVAKPHAGGIQLGEETGAVFKESLIRRFDKRASDGHDFALIANNATQIVRSDDLSLKCE